LLTQQYAAPSATGEEVDQDLFVLAFCLGESPIKASFKPVLSGGLAGEEHYHRQSNKPLVHAHSSL